MRIKEIFDLDAPPEIEPAISTMDESRVPDCTTRLSLNWRKQRKSRISHLKGRASWISGAGVGVEAGSENQRKITLNPPSFARSKMHQRYEVCPRNVPENYFTREGDFILKVKRRTYAGN